MASITFELVLGSDRETYDNLCKALPEGDNNLTRGVIVPAHPENQPQTFLVSNLTPNISYSVDFQGEWQTASTPRMHFVPIGTTQTLTVSLPYGPVTVILQDMYGSVSKFLLSIVNYATLFRTYASDITGYSKVPLQAVQDSIQSNLAFRLATPMLAELTELVPSDLEILASLSHKLLVKNLLSFPGTLGATTEILAAFSASNPIFFQMQNTNEFDSPLYRSEEVFQGYEAHVWLPNREVERWKAFIQLINNLPQLYTLQQITEGEVYIKQAGQLRRHLFDFDSPFANSITSGLTYLTDCFLRLFSLTVSVETVHFLAFCQATYILDQLILQALSPSDADPMAISPFQSFSLSGRWQQQFDITPSVHEWYYDSPLQGKADGVNRFYKLRKLPVSTSAVKVFVDGLLKRLYIDYRVSLNGSIISSAYKVLTLPQGPLLIDIALGQPRPFEGPVFSSLECHGGADLQLLLTGVEQGLDKVSFIVSHQPVLDSSDPESIVIHFVTPITANSGSPGDNQYGQIPMTPGISSYVLTFTQPTLTIDYQLFVSLTVNPMPSNDPTLVDQIIHIVREHTLNGVTIEFSAPLPDNVTLNWWCIETSSLTLERGTLALSNGMSEISIPFTNGPYFDMVVILFQLWNINPTFVDSSEYLVSCTTIGPGETTAKFSGLMDSDSYRLDYAVFPARGGDFVEFFEAPVGLVEAHYDIRWPDWINAGLSPQPDGIRTTFSLPYPVTDPNSVYLALDGRLMTQGNDHQYTVQTDMTTVTFTFAPTPSQAIWSVYPVSPSGQLPSIWSQGMLNYLPVSTGEYATGWIKTLSAMPRTHSVSVSVSDTVFKSIPSARGQIVNGNIISVGSSVTWQKLGITLTGSPTPNASLNVTGTTTLGSPVITSVTPSTIGLTTGMMLSGLTVPADTFILSVDSLTQITITNSSLVSGTHIHLIASYYDQFQVGISKDDDTTALINAINSHATLSLYYMASSPASGFIDVIAKALGNGLYDDRLIAIGSLTALDITGDTSPCSYKSCTIYSKQHTASVASSLDIDIVGNTFHHPYHTFFDGLSVQAVTSDVFPSPITGSTLYYVVNPTATTFQLSLSPYGSPIDLTDAGSGYQTFTSQDIEIQTSTFVFPTETVLLAGDTAVGSPIVTNILPSTANLKIGMSVSGTSISSSSIISSIDSSIQITLNTNAVASSVASLITCKDIFLNNESVGFKTTAILPTGLNLGQEYYAINMTKNRFQVSSVPNGSPVVFTDTGSGELIVYSIPKFASSINQSLDTLNLATEIGKHPITSNLVAVSVTNSVITVTAKEIGTKGDITLAVSDPSVLECQGLSAGRDPRSMPIYASGNICYYYDAPVVTLDGLSTRLWKQYEGDKFLFTSQPSLKQESYYISEIYPIDNHPLDSTIANLPCNYPKGVFTQGFGTHFNETDIAVDQPGTLVVSTANLPIQQQPVGIVDGVNTVFTITFNSCAGQNSMMVWQDGIFQPPDKYVYTDMGLYGRITFLSPPSVGQELWCWYLPFGTACADERVNALTGTIDGTNQVFSVPDSPWTNSLCLCVFLEGLFVLQNQDYTVLAGNTQITFTGSLSPAVGQSLWSHYNLGSIVPVDSWQQIYIGMTDGVSNTYMIPHILSSQLPTSTNSVLVFLDGLNQGNHFTIEVDSFGNPTGNIVFQDGPPEAGRRLETVYIRK